MKIYAITKNGYFKKFYYTKTREEAGYMGRSFWPEDNGTGREDKFFFELFNSWSTIPERILAPQLSRNKMELESLPDIEEKLGIKLKAGSSNETIKSFDKIKFNSIKSAKSLSNTYNYIIGSSNKNVLFIPYSNKEPEIVKRTFVSGEPNNYIKFNLITIIRIKDNDERRRIMGNISYGKKSNKDIFIDGLIAHEVIDEYYVMLNSVYINLSTVNIIQGIDSYIKELNTNRKRLTRNLEKTIKNLDIDEDMIAIKSKLNKIRKSVEHNQMILKNEKKLVTTIENYTILKSFFNNTSSNYSKKLTDKDGYEFQVNLTDSPMPKEVSKILRSLGIMTAMFSGIAGISDIKIDKAFREMVKDDNFSLSNLIIWESRENVKKSPNDNYSFDEAMDRYLHDVGESPLALSDEEPYDYGEDEDGDYEEDEEYSEEEQREVVQRIRETQESRIRDRPHVHTGRDGLYAWENAVGNSASTISFTVTSENSNANIGTRTPSRRLNVTSNPLDNI